MSFLITNEIEALFFLNRLSSGELQVVTQADQQPEGSLPIPEMESYYFYPHIKEAIVKCFGFLPMKEITPESWDKFPINLPRETHLRYRRVPGAIVRIGSYVSPKAILMPSFVNLGGYVGDGSMIDTWATVGSCAYVGKNVHLSGGVGLGGVLEPAQSHPVVIGDGAFLGSRSIVVEGVSIGAEAVIGAGVVLTASTKIYDLRDGDGDNYRIGNVPPRSVVIPGSRPYRSGSAFHTPCALIIGNRKPSTDLKTSLNSALRDFGVSV